VPPTCLAVTKIWSHSLFLLGGIWIAHPAESKISRGDIRQRRRAVRKLFELDKPSSLGAFIALLDDEDAWFRQKAMDAINRWFTAVDCKIVKKLVASNFPEQRVLASTVSRNCEDYEEILLELSEDNVRSVKIAAWNSRLDVDDEEVSPIIQGAFSSDDYDIRKCAVRRLGKMEDLDKEVLLLALDDSSPMIVKSAIAILQAKGGLLDEDVVSERLNSIAKGKNSDLRISALGVVSRNIGRNSEVKDIVIDAIRNCSAPMANSLAKGLRGVEWWRMDEVRGAIISTRNESLVIRLLRGQRDESVVEIRNRVLSDPDRPVETKTRIVEDLMGREISISTLEIVRIMAESADETLSKTSRILLNELG